jgi:hypothetical protein
VRTNPSAPTWSKDSSKGSVAEVLKRLRKAYYRRYITRDVLDARIAQGEELKQMLGGFIKYLEQSDWKDRGYHQAALEKEQVEEQQEPRQKRRPRA